MFVASFSNAAKIDTLFVWSKSMFKKVPNLVIIPSGYHASKTRFPVVYLLHGANDNFLGWIQISPDLPHFADLYKVIIVCPDGGETSWYFDSPVDDKMRYETYMTKELLPAIDSKYKTINNKSGRAISGLSMGGHGAFYLAIRHQDLYGAIGSMSGCVDIRPFSTHWDLAKRLGTYETHPANWENNTVINMLLLIKSTSLKIIFDCGTEDFFHKVNKKLHEEMLKRKIQHNYSERPGGHSAEYWATSIKYHMLFFNNFFTHPGK